MPPHRACLALLLVTLGACTAKPAGRQPEEAGPARLEPAPRPFAQPARRPGTVGALEVPLPPKMPLGTGAVPVSGGAARGSIVTGFREAF